MIARSLVILGCSQRKKQTSRLIPAIDRYDGPVFRVLRKHASAIPELPPDVYILSGKFGLIPGEFLIPSYNHRLTRTDHLTLRSQVDRQLRKTLDDHQPKRVFVSVGSQYWPLIEEPINREVPSAQLLVATGSIGGRASKLSNWLRQGQVERDRSTLGQAPGEAVLLGTKVRLSRTEVLSEARKALHATPDAAHRFETWYVAVGSERIAPKWLISILFQKPVARFRTADAKRALRQLGIETRYAD